MMPEITMAWQVLALGFIHAAGGFCAASALMLAVLAQAEPSTGSGRVAPHGEREPLGASSRTMRARAAILAGAAVFLLAAGMVLGS